MGFVPGEGLQLRWQQLSGTSLEAEFRRTMNKSLYKVLALGAVFAASATLAMASQIPGNSSISVTGPSLYNQAAETVEFPASPQPPAPGDLYSINGIGSTGAFSPFTPGQPITWFLQGLGPITLGNPSSSMSSPVYNSPGPGGLPIFSVTESGQTATFTLASEFYIPSSFDGLSSVDVYGTGTFTLTGYAPTPGNFEFTINNATSTVSGSFSGTGIAAPTPEPSSLALLGTGLLGAAALARRRFSARFSA